MNHFNQRSVNEIRSCIKTARTCAIIATFILFSYTFSFAQNEGIKGVQFTDGSILYGKVIEMSAENIQIETEDGKIISRNFDEVESFIITENLSGIRFKDGSIIYGKIIEMDMNKVIIVTKDDKAITRKFSDVASFIKKGDEKIIERFFVLGTEISYIKYNEPDMQEKDMMYGIVGSYAYHYNKFILKAEGKFAYGQVDYDGATLSGTPLTISDIPDYMLEFRGLLGYDFVVKNITITPDFGIGYRWLQDNTQEKSPSGYQRESNYLYLPIGVEAITNLGKGWSWGASVEYDVFLWGEQKTYLSDFNPGYNDIGNRQTLGYGARGSISIAKKGEKIGFIVEPYIRYWNIKDSDYSNITYYGTYTGSYGYEPNNNSTEIGCKLAVTF